MNYIQPYLVKSSVDLVILKTLNYHWEIKVLYLGEKRINHSEFQKYFQRIPDLETKERVSTKYTSNSLVFTVYSQQNNCLKLTGCTKQIEKVPSIKQIFLSANQDITSICNEIPSDFSSPSVARYKPVFSHRLLHIFLSNIQYR